MADVPPDRDDGQPAEPPGHEAPGATDQGATAVPETPATEPPATEPPATEPPATEPYAAWTPSSPSPPTSPGSTRSSGDPGVGPAAAGSHDTEAPHAQTPPWGSPPWAGPPWQHDQAAWGPPPPWAAWYMWGPGAWQGSPGSTWQTPPVPPPPPASRRQTPVPWAVVGAAAAVLALVGVGIGIGYGVWGTSAPVASATSNTAQHAPKVPGTPSGGGTRHAFLGVELAPGGFVTGPPSSPTRGALVQKVVPGSPAARAGIVAGDTITSFGTQAVASDLALAFDVQHDVPGQRVKVDWTTTAGKHDSATVRLGSRPGGRAIG